MVFASIQERKRMKTKVEEYLTSVFHLPSEVVDNYSSLITIDEVDAVQTKLSAVVGGEYAAGLVEINPDILFYETQKNPRVPKQIGEYVRLLKVVNGIITSEPEHQEKLDCEFCIERNMRKYASIESLIELKEELQESYNLLKGTDEQTEESSSGIDLSSIEIHKYTFLHPGKEEVEKRLDSLINNGEIVVGDHEHWTSTSGARGSRIVRVIYHQINRLLDQLGLHYNCKTNYADNTLRIDDETRYNLKVLRDMVYERGKNEASL